LSSSEGGAEEAQPPEQPALRRRELLARLRRPWLGRPVSKLGEVIAA